MLQNCKRKNIMLKVKMHEPDQTHRTQSVQRSKAEGRARPRWIPSGLFVCHVSVSASLTTSRAASAGPSALLTVQHGPCRPSAHKPVLWLTCCSCWSPPISGFLGSGIRVFAFSSRCSSLQIHSAEQSLNLRRRSQQAGRVLSSPQQSVPVLEGKWQYLTLTGEDPPASTTLALCAVYFKQLFFISLYDFIVLLLKKHDEPLRFEGGLSFEVFRPDTPVWRWTTKLAAGWLTLQRRYTFWFFQTPAFSVRRTWNAELWCFCCLPSRPFRFLCFMSLEVFVVTCVEKMHWLY